MTDSKITVHNKGTEWECIEAKGRWADWTFDSVNKNNDVTIECWCDEGSNTLFLTQEELKQVIAFLQKQIKQ